MRPLLIAGTALLALAASPARATYIVTFTQVGPDVVATGTGSIDLQGLMPSFNVFGALPEIDPRRALVQTGSAAAVARFRATVPVQWGRITNTSGVDPFGQCGSGSGGQVQNCAGGGNGTGSGNSGSPPPEFGSGTSTQATQASGPLVGIDATDGWIEVPQGYQSNSLITDGATYADATFASLGLTPGDYLFTIGGTASVEVIVDDSSGKPPPKQAPSSDPVAIPEPESLAVFGTALLTLGVLRRTRRDQHRHPHARS